MLEKNKSANVEWIDVRAEPKSPEETLNILAGVRYLFGKRGAKLVSLDRKKDEPSDEEILKLFLGRSGTMRAPVLVRGNKAVGGYDEALYREILGL